MSERTAPSLAILDELLPTLRALPAAGHRDQLVDETEALRRAVAAFHMEAIRFRIFTVDRLIKADGDAPALRALVERLREALETAGFHTRSHAAPGA
jgi:2'-5' RNA ligase